MEKITSKCKNCGSELKFNPLKQTLSCQYCESTYHLPKANINSILVRGYTNSFHPIQLNQSLNCYECEMCGHTYFSSSEEMSKECPDCGSASIKVIQSAGYCADGIIPFEISKEQASEKLLNYFKLNPIIPKDMIKKATPQNLIGTYIPVWNFVFDIDVTFSANAVQLKKNSSGMYYSIPFPVFGQKTIPIKSADQCATSFQNDDFLDLFDEKDYDKIIPYTPEYTFGFKVENINRDIHSFYETATQNEELIIQKEIGNHILNKHKDVSDMQIITTPRDVYFNFTYVPVYVYKFNYRGKTYKNYISGTTGKVAGKTPKTLKGMFKILLKFLGLGAIIAILYLLFIK